MTASLSGLRMPVPMLVHCEQPKILIRSNWHGHGPTSYRMDFAVTVAPDRHGHSAAAERVDSSSDLSSGSSETECKIHSSSSKYTTFIT